jgi:outer membrane protein TolC
MCPAVFCNHLLNSVMSAYAVTIAKRIGLALLIGLISATPLLAQDADPLGSYVRVALQNNLGLKQQQIGLDQRDAALRQARGLFLPNLTVDTRYSETQGGLNLGDLVNPAYRALNQLTKSSQFPTNIDGRFPYAQETRMRVVQPLFNAAIVSNYKINARLKDVQDARVRTSARQLAADVQLAYANHARAARVVEVYRATQSLVNENTRVARKLLENGKVTADAVHRAEAQRLEVEQQLADSEQKRSAAAGYFNLVLDRPLESAIDLVADSLLLSPVTITIEQAVAHARKAREELEQVEQGVKAAEANARLARSSYLPSISLAVDYGVQGQQYRFNAESDFAMVSVVASWNLFNGLQDAARAEHASLDAQRGRVQHAELERQIELQVRTAYDALRVAEKSLVAADARNEAARRSYELVARRYAEGMASTLELLDARTTYTSAELNCVLTRHDYFARRVELERAAALRNLANDFTVER